MGHVELFLLFPVYRESEHQPCYLKRVDEMDKASYLKYRNAVETVRSFFLYESFEGYYDSKNVKAFMEPVYALEDCYPRNLSMLLRKTLIDWGHDWRNHKRVCQGECCSYFGEKLTDETICEMVKRQSMDADNSYLLLDNGALAHVDSHVKVLFHEESFELSCCDMNTVGLSDWFSKNRKPVRKFNLNPKHGENGKGAHLEHKGDSVSILLCSKETASELLDRAVGVEAGARTLYFYDIDNEKFIEFKQESDNVYHGFHLGEAEARERIPKNVIEKIKQLIG